MPSSGEFPERARRIIIERAGRCCERCGRYAEGGSIHHRTPRGMGGSRDPLISTVPNGVLLCGSGTSGCHGWVETHRAEARADGWLVPRGVDPATVPVRHVHFGLVYLDPDGMYLFELPDRSTT